LLITTARIKGKTFVLFLLAAWDVYNKKDDNEVLMVFDNPMHLRIRYIMVCITSNTYQLESKKLDMKKQDYEKFMKKCTVYIDEPSGIKSSESFLIDIMHKDVKPYKIIGAATPFPDTFYNTIIKLIDQGWISKIKHLHFPISKEDDDEEIRETIGEKSYDVQYRANIY